MHNPGRYLCSPCTKKTCGTLRTSLVKILCILHFQWLDLVGVDVVSVAVVVDVVGVLGPSSVGWTQRPNFILELEW